MIRCLSITYKIFLILAVSACTAFAAKLPTIKEIDLDIRGPQNLSDEAILARIKLEEGQEYNQRMATQSIKSLYETGLFRSINIRLDEISKDETIVTFEMEANPIIDNVCIQGNRKLSSRTLLEEIKIKAGDPLNEPLLAADVQRLKKKYEDKGYSGNDIRYVVDYDECTGRANVTFCIEEGCKVKITSIRFCGNDPIKPKCLHEIMQTKKANLFSFLTGAGKYKEEAFLDDIQRLKDYFRDQGYLDVEIPEDEICIAYNGPTHMCITINIDKGPLYCVGNVCLSGNTLYTTERLMPLVSVKPGDIFSPSCIEQDRENLINAYGEVGYLDTYVIAERRPNLETGAIDIHYEIHESDKFCLESISIQGNCKTKSSVIMRELLLEPGDVFDLVRMKNSQSRLQNTGYFDEVNLIPEPSSIPGRKNMNIAVKEARTGSVNLGVAFNNVEKMVGSIELSQSNFDFMNYRSFFQGAGQKFNVKFHFGKRSKSLLVNFEEPALCDREVAVGFNFFWNDSKFVSNVYDQTRIGIEVYMRKRVFEMVIGQLAYLVEQVDIKNMAANARPELQKEKGKRTVSRLGLGFSRDTRDNFVYPTRGTATNLNFQLAGGPLGGSTHYLKVDAGTAFWYSPFDFGEHVLMAGVRTGTVMPYGGHGNVPIFDRYFLGGQDDLRGYDYHTVGPKDANNEPLGGNTTVFTSVEYTFKVMDPMRLAVFYDGGFISKADWTYKFNEYRDDVGFGIRIFVMGAPLRLDWGYPLSPIKGQRKGLKFNLAFGAVF